MTSVHVDPVAKCTRPHQEWCSVSFALRWTGCDDIISWSFPRSRMKMDPRSVAAGRRGCRPTGLVAETWGSLTGAANHFKSVTQLFCPRVKFCYRAKTPLNDILLLGNINFRGRRQTATGNRPDTVNSTNLGLPPPAPRRQHIATKYVRAQIQTRWWFQSFEEHLGAQPQLSGTREACTYDIFSHFNFKDTAP